MLNFLRKRTIEAIWQKKNHPNTRFVWVVIDKGLCIGFGESTSNRNGLGIKVVNNGRIAYIQPNWIILAMNRCYGEMLCQLSDRKIQQVIETFSRLNYNEIRVSMFEHDKEYTLRGNDKNKVITMLCKKLELVQR